MRNFYYSIIIPHHNIPILLERCLKTIPKRSDLQIIVVDDNSDEMFLPQLFDLQSKYNYVTFIFSKEKNKGGGYARNVGLKTAIGKYILFADADDFFSQCFNEILDIYNTIETDIVYFNANAVDSTYFTHSQRVNHLNKLFELHKKDPKKAELKFKYVFGEPWCKMVRKDIIDKYTISFEETSIHNDTQFSYLVGFHCKKAIFDKHAIYYVTERNNSVSKQISPEKWIQRTIVFAKANNFFSKNNIKIFNQSVFAGFYHFKKTKNKLLKKTCFEIFKQYSIPKRKLFTYLIYRKIKNIRNKIIKYYKLLLKKK